MVTKDHDDAAPCILGGAEVCGRLLSRSIDKNPGSRQCFVTHAARRPLLIIRAKPRSKQADRMNTGEFSQFSVFQLISYQHLLMPLFLDRGLFVIFTKDGTRCLLHTHTYIQLNNNNNKKSDDVWGYPCICSISFVSLSLPCNRQSTQNTVFLLLRNTKRVMILNAQNRSCFLLYCLSPLWFV